MTFNKTSATRGPVYLDSSGDPAPIFKQGRGKPSVRIEYLKQQRDAWIWPLESCWSEFGWILESAHTLVDISEAFRIVSSRFSSDLFQPFLRSTIEKSTVNDVAQFRKTYEKAVEAMVEAEKAYRERYDERAEAQRTASVLSKDFQRQLRNDLDQREQRVRSLKILRSRVRARTTKYGLLRAKYIKEGRHRDYTPFLLEKLRRIDADIAADEKAGADEQARLRQITPANRKIAAEELENRTRLVDSGKRTLDQSVEKYKHAEKVLQDREAFVWRNELLEFVISKKYAIEPRQIAKALAGLPYEKCRRSAERLVNLKSAVPPFLTHGIFLFIRSRFEKWRLSRSIPLVESFKREIIRLPKSIGRGRDKRDDPLRKRLAKDWYYLRNAIAEGQGLQPRKIPKHYFITQRFLSESANPTSPIDRILADKEAIVS